MKGNVKMKKFTSILALFIIFVLYLVMAVLGQTSGLVAHWKFDEGSGNFASDQTGTHNGTLQGSPAWVVGFSGTALQFSPNKRVNVPDAVFGNIDFTHSARIKTSSLVGYIIGKGDDCDVRVFNGRILFTYRGTQHVFGVRLINDNLWHHIAVVRAGNTVKIFVDGVIDKQQTISGVLSVGFYTLASRNDVTAVDGFTGTLDEMSFYNRALSDIEVANLAGAIPLPTPTSTPTVTPTPSVSPIPCPIPSPCFCPTPTPTPTPTVTPTPNGINVTLDGSLQFQTMTGWEAVAQAGQLDFSDWNTYKESLMDALAADGINRIRVEVAITDEASTPTATVPTNDNNDPFTTNNTGFQWAKIDSQAEIVNMLRTRLATRGEPMPWVTLCYVDFLPTATFAHANSPEEHAELIETSFIHLDNLHGWVPDAVEIILEPDNGSNTRWNATKIAINLLAIRNRLASHNWNPRFIVPSTVQCPNAQSWYANIKAAQPTVTQYIDEVSYHRYVDCDGPTLNLLQAAVEADGNRIVMSEFIGAAYANLHDFLKHNGTSWQQFTIAYDDSADTGGAYYLVNHNSHTFTIASRTKFLRQYFKFIRRGAVRISATSNNTTIDPIAFINNGGKYVVVVSAMSGQSFNVLGLPPATYGIKYTTTNQYDFDLPDQTMNGGSLTTAIPGTGVITIYAR